ncbi:aminopeptidase N-like isoform X2 [Penaeus monodon]|uniref:aminopeptidase N-like isoform X2 n=1 Tax=Penaeus monodon TaxID=6687 RepID=UPI0018A7D187|nr:aminopeptidase N-like isoform X2 [Penaeus monodon]
MLTPTGYFSLARMLVFVLLLVGLVPDFTDSTILHQSFNPRRNVRELLTRTSESLGNEYFTKRLPRSIKPLHYLIKLQPLINGNFSILGYVEVEMEVLEPTSNITLHMADIITKNDTFKVSALGKRGGQTVKIKNARYDNKAQFLVLRLEETLARGENYALAMEYVGYLNEYLYGFYRADYVDYDGSIKYMAATLFQPTHARRAFPCFDEPALKATFEVHLARETWMTSLSNMPLAETRPIEGQEGWVWDRFERSVPMSTYLVIFIVSEFTYVNVTDGGHVPFRMFAHRTRTDQLSYASEVAPKILRFFEDYFDSLYVLPKLDIFALPQSIVPGMENWGLITFGESYLFYDPDATLPQNLEFTGSLIGHELAHNWFGNLVTPAWWDDLWLNEGFATYMGHVGLDRVMPDWKVMDTFVGRTLQRSFLVDSLEGSHKVSISTAEVTDIMQIFDAITYYKGASVVRMLQHCLGEETFIRGLNNYLKAFKYSNAVQDDLWEFLTVAAHQDKALAKDLSVKMIMDTWTLQKGFPVIEVIRSIDGALPFVTQKRFQSEKNMLKDTHDYRWMVPLTYTTQSEANFNHTQAMVWMKDCEEHINLASLPMKDQWVIFNLQETGYYRVNYDDHNWNLLIQQLKDDHEVIHVINRAQLIDDANALAEVGYLDYKIPMNILSYLRKESDYLPWAVAINIFSSMTSLFNDRQEYGALKQFILELVLTLYNEVGFHGSVESPFVSQKKRKIAVSWACILGHKDCLHRARKFYRQWMTTAPSLRPIVLCHGIAEGGAAEWNFAWNRYLNETDQAEIYLLLSIMACSKDAETLKRYLEMVVDPETNVKTIDLTTVFISIGQNELGRRLVWDYFTEHWNDLFSTWKALRGEVLTRLTYFFNTRQELEDMELFLNNEKIDKTDSELKIGHALKRARHNLAWMEANYGFIKRWLEENGYSSKPL